MAPPSRNKTTSKKQKSTFNQKAVKGEARIKKWPMKKIAIFATPVVLMVGWFWVQSLFVAPKGSNLYGLCRGYIEQQMQFPQTLKIIEFKERIPDGENPSSPQRLNQEVTFSSVDGFGSRTLHTVTCGFKFNSDLLGTPWQGIFLERVLFDGSLDHGWSDVYYAPNDPRAAQDTNKRLERFFNGIPALLSNPPDLTLPMRDINRMQVKDLQDL